MAHSASMRRELRRQLKIIGALVAVMWLVEIADTLIFGGRLDALGIYPRELFGLRGILFAPFLHGGFAHLIANTVPLVTLAWLVMFRRTSEFFVVTALVMLIGGGGVWLLGRPAMHIGASGLIFGYLGFLLLRGYFEKRLGSVIFSALIGGVYGGMLWGVLPGLPGVSWEGHLFGFIGGVVAAWVLAKTS